MLSKMYWRLPKHSFSKFWTALYEAILSECCYSTSRITSCALFDQLLRSTRLFVFSWRVTGWVCVGSQLTALLYWLFFDIWNIFLQWIFGIFDGDFELIVMESTQFSDEIRRRRRHRHRGCRNGSIGCCRHSDPTYKLASRVTSETYCKFWGKCDVVEVKKQCRYWYVQWISRVTCDRKRHSWM